MANPLFDFRHLTPPERAQLAVDLWDSIARDREDELPIPPEHRAELERRHAGYLQQSDAGAPWEEVQERLLARLQEQRETRQRRR